MQEIPLHACDSMRPVNEATQTPFSIYTSCQPFVNFVLPSSTCFQWSGERDTFTFVYIRNLLAASPLISS